MRPLLALLFALALAGCVQVRTELVVRVDSQLPWGPGQAVQSVVLEIRREGPSGPLRSLRTTVVGAAAGQHPLPFTVGVTPADDSDAPVWFRLLGCSSSVGCTPADAVARAEAAERFVPGQTRDVALALGVADASVDGGNDAGELPDVAGVDGGGPTSDAPPAPCVPVCGAGQRCEAGHCEVFDAGAEAGAEAGADVPALSDAALATLFRTCEPIGSECAPGVRCLPGFRDAGTRGVCTIPCELKTECDRYGAHAVCWGTSTRACLLSCTTTGTRPCPADDGVCQVINIPPLGFCNP